MSEIPYSQQTMNNKMKKFRSKNYKLKPNDKIYTPKAVAELMIKMCTIKPTDKVLDPSLGGGVFYDNLPPCTKEFCEIEKGIDFFDASGEYSLIIGNPPYSLWNAWLNKTMELTNKLCFLWGIMNFTHHRMNRILEQGYVLTHYHLLKVSYWFSHHVIVIFEKCDPATLCKITVSGKEFKCECGKRCGRGAGGKNYNICGNLQKI
jgi:hypothetical protein|tara:strand:- start:96 stop:710 length:615 start_codon:yes stop_codon:yes gene_type:complete